MVTRVLFVALIGALSTPAALGCGARTDLDRPELCGTESEVRPCTNTCGSGTRTCRDGYWRDCEVAPVQSSCEDACGAGTRTCVDGAWRACEVEPVSVSCVTECGSGTSTCRGGAWGGCEVPPITRACMSVCGPGTETCVGAAWQACTAPQPKPPKLRAVIRDFNGPGHPDFERPGPGGFEPGIVEPLLGPDDKPVFDIIDLLDDASRKRLARYARSGPGRGPSGELYPGSGR